MQYAAHGWPVAPLAVPHEGRCPCRRGDCLEPHLVRTTALTDRGQVDQVWAGQGWDIALVTSRFEVVDIPARFGAPLHHQLKTACPTAMAPLGRRWHFYLSTGSLDADLVTGVGGVLHSGSDDWVAAPGTRTETTGRIRWLVPPYQTNWQPHRRKDPFDRIFSPND